MLSLLGTSEAEQRFESFDRDPSWDAHRNRVLRPETVRQDFGYSTDTAHAGVAHAGKWVALYNPPPKRPYFRVPR